VGRKLSRIEPGHFYALLDHVIDRLRVQRPARNIPPAIDRPEDTTLVDLCSIKPGVQGINGTSSKIDHFIVFSAAGLCAAKMNGKR